MRNLRTKKPLFILGVSAYYHDSSACLLKDGRVIAAFEEERFSRKKHDNRFPVNAIKMCLKTSRVKPRDIQYIAYYEKPLLKFERTLEILMEMWPRDSASFVKGIRSWLGRKLRLKNTFKKLGFKNAKILYSTHHLSHAAATYLTSPFRNTAVLTIDGIGEYQTTVLWRAQGTKLTPLKELNFPHSLGLLYSAFTAFLGFKVNNDEYKVMGLSAYGKPRYKERFKLIADICKDGSLRLKTDIFWIQNFEKVFGKRRLSNENITQRHKDVASSLQSFMEEVYFKTLNYLYELIGEKNLCIGGGVGLNSLANGKIWENTPFKNVWVFGPAGDSGSSVGSALFTYNKLIDKKRKIEPQTQLFFGSNYSNNEVLQEIKKYGLRFRKFKSKKELVNKTAELLSKNKIIGWFQGRMEFGPRALGARSILANPKNRDMKRKVNLIKRREQFRPFAGSILEEKAGEYFELPQTGGWFSFMNFVFPVKKQARDKISAIVHKDGTCRIQTVSKKENELYYLLIKRFYEKTGIACLLNTSFNLKGEPIVENPSQAINDFLRTSMDYLVIENFIVYK